MGVGWGGVGCGGVGWGGVLFTQLHRLTKNVNKSLLISRGGYSQRRESDSAGFDLPGGWGWGWGGVGLGWVGWGSAVHAGSQRI